MSTSERIEPRISSNKLGQYITSKPRRQHTILYEQKFPSDYITAYYKDAQESISLFVAKGMEDASVLDKRIRLLEQKKPETVWQGRQIVSNIDAIEAFMNIADQVQLFDFTPEIGDFRAQKLNVNGVSVSIRPEIILSGKKRGMPAVGGIKLHFIKSHPLDEESAGYVSAITQMYLGTHMAERGKVDGRLCSVIDLSAGRVFAGVTSLKVRQKEIEAACEQIRHLWPTIAE